MSVTQSLEPSPIDIIRRRLDSFQGTETKQKGHSSRSLPVQTNYSLPALGVSPAVAAADTLSLAAVAEAMDRPVATAAVADSV